MNKKLLIASVLGSIMLLATGCSTTANFKVPENTKLTVYERVNTPIDQNGNVKTSPFFWSAAGGIPYRLQDSSGNVLREGRLKSRFRVVSIFWPPFALIYWPMGFGSGFYDLTHEADGIMVRDTVNNVAKAAPAVEAPVKAKKAK